MNKNYANAGAGRGVFIGLLALTILAGTAQVRADDTDRFHRFFDHMVETYYKPVGINAEDVDDLFRVTNGRFVAITMGYGLSRQARMVQQEKARHQIFNGLIDRVGTLLDNFAEAELNNAAGGRADKAAVEKYKGELHDLFAAALAGYVDKEVEAFGVPPKIPSVFEEDAYKLQYPQSMPPVSYMFTRWSVMTAYDGKAVGYYGSKMLTSKTGQYGYLFEEVKEDVYGKKALKFWRIEGDRMLWFRANGTLFADMKFSVNKDRWQFYGKMYNEKGEHLLNQSDKKYMNQIVWLDIPDRFAVQVPTGSAGQSTASTGAGTSTTASATPSTATTIAGPLTSEGDEESKSEEEISLRGDPVAVKVALKEIRKWGMSGNLYKLRGLSTGNALKQLQYAQEWRSKNRLKAKAYEKLLLLASLSFGEPQLNDAGDEATATGNLSVWGKRIPYQIDAVELKLVEGVWKLANVRYTKLEEDKEEDN